METLGIANHDTKEQIIEARLTIGSDFADLFERIGIVLLGGLALVPVVAVVALALSHRGLFGEISHAWRSLTSSDSVVRDNARRLTQLGSSRPLYWQQGLDVGVHNLLKGAGELGYGVARLRYTTSQFKTDQAHSYVVQTFADLGLIGIALTVALLVAWCAGRGEIARRRRSLAGAYPRADDRAPGTHRPRGRRRRVRDRSPAWTSPSTSRAWPSRP